MATKAQTVTKSLVKANSTREPRLYRVWRHTTGDESMHEIIVLATSPADAQAKAIAHVKATNPGKGTRSKAASEKLTTVLSVKRVVHKNCLEISQVPVAAILAIPRSATPKVKPAKLKAKATKPKAKGSRQT